MYKEISKCRICGNSDLVPVLDLGVQALTGVFPKTKDQLVTSGPLILVKCQEDEEGKHCGLLQLKHSYDLGEMYGDNYGYRSGLNHSMVQHLNAKVKRILAAVELKANDLVIDIGSNDSTLLQAYPNKGYVLAGIDPTGIKFKQYYPSHVQLVPDFFSAAAVKKNWGEKKAKIITSIAMFYDLEAPLDFMRQVYDVLADDGVWVFEQSYMPTMLEMNSYDTACHEHLEYYRLKQIKWMADRVGFKILDIEFNKINGGSFSVMLAKKQSQYAENVSLVNEILLKEEALGLNILKPYSEFKARVFAHRDQLRAFVEAANKRGEKVFGYGASTKGNVILQFCNLTEKDIPFIAEVNIDKFGCYTPGTLIPIISEDDARRLNPDYFMVLLWHFKDSIILKEKNFMSRGRGLVFPLPNIETITHN
ncbi:MAG: class I SAM-dependent methyltransferase [Candidatus Margulisiibacteriota bacterium]